VEANQNVYRTGQRFLASIGLWNPGLTSTVDVYLLEFLPDGDQVVMFTDRGVEMGRTSAPEGWRPLVPALDLGTPFDWEASDLFDYRWTGSEDAGYYGIVLAAVLPGALADGRVDSGDLLAFGAAWFAFSP
jgi:hypothetical protein